MSQPTTGRAWLVDTNLPTSKVVTGATNATPPATIVVTTSTAHNLSTNEIVKITGVGGNGSANGTFVAVVLSPTTLALTTYPGRANVAGSGGYTSGGSLQSLGFGIRVPLPNDLTDMMTAGSVGVPFESNLDMSAYLMLRAGPFGELVTLINSVSADVSALNAITPRIEEAIGPAHGAETLTGSGALPGTYVKSTAILAQFATVAKAGDVLTCTCQVDMLAFIAAGGLSGAQAKIVALQDAGGGNIAADVPGALWSFGYLGAGVGTGVQVNTVLTGQFTVATPGPLQFYLAVRLANTESVQIGATNNEGTIQGQRLRIGP